MINAAKQYVKRVYTWFCSWVHTRYAEPMLAATFYFESFLLFLPTDPMLILYCIEHRAKAVRYAIIATLFSVLGGITGYLIGLFLWSYAGQEIIHNSLVNLIMTPELFNHACSLYQQHEWLAIFIAGFTPVPYKAATLCAGFCNLSFIPFVVCSLLARGARYLLIAYIIKIFGKNIQQYIERYFNLIASLIFVIIVGLLWFLRG